MYVDQHRVFVHAGIDPNCPLHEQDAETVMWKIYPDDDDGGHGQRHVVHGHHQHAHGPIFKKNRTNLDTCAWYTGRLAVGVFDDTTPGGPIEVLEVNGEPIEKILSNRRSTDMPSRSAMSAFGGRIQLIDATPFPSNLARWNDMHMEGHARTWFTPKQKAELWERWKSGQWVADVARALEERKAVSKILALNGGIALAPHRRAPASSVAVTG